MKIATWNVEHVRPGKGARTERIRAETQRVRADVWILTESHPAFAPSDGHRLVAMSGPAPDRSNGERWVCVWVRSDLSARHVAVGGERERCAVVLVSSIGGPAVLAIGTVLPWRGDRRRPAIRGAAAFLRALKVQATAWERAMRRFPDAVCCIGGDLNQEIDADGPVGTAAGREALVNALERLNLVCVTRGDEDPLRKRGWRSSIDHFAVSKKAVARTSVGDPWPDAFPLPSTMPDHHGVQIVLA